MFEHEIPQFKAAFDSIFQGYDPKFCMIVAKKRISRRFRNQSDREHWLQLTITSLRIPSNGNLRYCKDLLTNYVTCITIGRWVIWNIVCNCFQNFYFSFNLENMLHILARSSRVPLQQTHSSGEKVFLSHEENPAKIPGVPPPCKHLPVQSQQ